MTDPRTRCQILLLLALLAPQCAAADVTDSVNSVRRHGCGAHPGGARPLRENARLDQVARQLSLGAELHGAQRLAGYRAVSSFAVRISAVPASGDVERIIGQQFCQQATDPAFREIGSWRRGADLWLAFAEPFTPPASHDRAAISRRVLELINQARARARRCGSTPFAAAPPLALNATLEHAAAQYARDLASFGYLDHTGRDGSGFATARAARRAGHIPGVVRPAAQQVVALDPVGELGEVGLGDQDAARLLHARDAGRVGIGSAAPEDR